MSVWFNSVQLRRSVRALTSQRGFCAKIDTSKAFRGSKVKKC